MEDYDINEFLVDGGNDGVTLTVPWFYAAGAALVVLLVVYYLRPDFLCGFWKATEEFCKASEVDSIMLYISEPSGILGRARAGYVIVGDAHQGFDLNVGFNWALNPYECRTSASIDYDAEDLWGPKIWIKSNGKSIQITDAEGKLVLFACRDF